MWGDRGNISGRRRPVRARADLQLQRRPGQVQRQLGGQRQRQLRFGLGIPAEVAPHKVKWVSFTRVPICLLRFS